MPLTRAPGVGKVDLNEIAFPMRDAASGVIVECRVSEDALRKLSGGGSSISSLEAMFEQHREAVENLASQKYDLGHASPHVRGATLIDVGSTKPLYAQAEFLTFCSAKLSRAMMEFARCTVCRGTHD